MSQCMNPRKHGPHRWLVDADAATEAPCPGRDRTIVARESDLSPRSTPASRTWAMEQAVKWTARDAEIAVGELLDLADAIEHYMLTGEGGWT